MEDEPDLTRRGSALFEGSADRGHEALGRIAGRGQDLASGLPAVFLKHHVGEGAADIDGKPNRSFPLRHSHLPELAIAAFCLVPT